MKYSLEDTGFGQRIILTKENGIKEPLTATEVIEILNSTVPKKHPTCNECPYLYSMVAKMTGSNREQEDIYFCTKRSKIMSNPNTQYCSEHYEFEDDGY